MIIKGNTVNSLSDSFCFWHKSWLINKYFARDWTRNSCDWQTLIADRNVSWWRHEMETFSALLAICAGNSPVPVNSPHKGQWRRASMFSLTCVWINDWVNNRKAGDLRHYRTHYDVIVMVNCLIWETRGCVIMRFICMVFEMFARVNASLLLFHN